MNQPAGQDSQVGTVTRLRVGEPRHLILFTAGEGILLLSTTSLLWGSSRLLFNGYRGSFSGGKVAGA
jgi:hypothetical protein